MVVNERLTSRWGPGRIAFLFFVLAVSAAPVLAQSGERTFVAADGTKITISRTLVSSSQGTVRAEVPTLVDGIAIADLIEGKLDALELDPLPGVAAPVTGYADLHLHQFGQLGHDGRSLHGSASAGGPLETALPSCTQGVASTGAEACGKLFFETLSPQLLAACGFALPLLNLPYEFLHSSHGVSYISDIIAGLFEGYSLYNVANHPTLPLVSGGQRDGGSAINGTPFRDWPVWYGIGHQPVGLSHLEEAHADGLRLIVMSAVNNEFLCKALPSNYGIVGRGGCGDMLNLARQLTEAWDFAADHSSWYEIALTPGEAGRIISEGKMAVVLAIEASNLFNVVTTSGGAGSQGVLGNLVFELSTNLGVRSIQPVHEFNSSLGGAAQQFAVLRTIEKLGDSLSSSIQGFLAAITSNAPPLQVDQQPGCENPNPAVFNASTCGHNILGLTPAGKEFIQLLMDSRLLIDVEHLSRRAIGDVLSLVEPVRYPVFLSHAQFDDISVKPFEQESEVEGGKGFDERQMPQEMVDRIRDVGGMVGLIMGALHTTTVFDDAGSPLVVNNCPGSSRSFAQAYLYADRKGLPVAFGSDLNGFIPTMRPRFRDPQRRHGRVGGGLANPDRWACGGDLTDDVSNAARAAFQIDQGQRATNGVGSDFDFIGLGHVGLLDDVLRDLQGLGVDTTRLEEGAQAFVTMWTAVGEYRSPEFRSPGQIAEEMCLEASTTALSCHVDPIRDLDVNFQAELGKVLDRVDSILNIVHDINLTAGVDVGPALDRERLKVGVEWALGRMFHRDVVLSPSAGLEIGEARAFSDNPFNINGTINLDGDVTTLDTFAVWQGTFNTDGTVDLDGNPRTLDQLWTGKRWDRTLNRDATVNYDGDPATPDTSFPKEKLNKEIFRSVG